MNIIHIYAVYIYVYCTYVYIYTYDCKCICILYTVYNIFHYIPIYRQVETQLWPLLAGLTPFPNSLCSFCSRSSYSGFRCGSRTKWCHGSTHRCYKKTVKTCGMAANANKDDRFFFISLMKLGLQYGIYSIIYSIYTHTYIYLPCSYLLTTAL